MNLSINIDGRLIGGNYPPYVIAELSANHNGSLEKALLAIETAHRCGASAVKLQTYTADTLTIDCDAPDFRVRGGLWDGYKLYDLYKWAQTPYEWHEAIFDYARKIGITIFSTPFDESAVDLLEHLNTPAYKIASFELVDLPLIRYVAQTGKPIIMSTGMASETEVEEAVDAAYSSGCRNLVLLHCISSYPAPIEQANLRKMSLLAKRFGTVAGLSDHTMGVTAAIAAIALGASVIEKHFTLSRADKGPDSDFSLEPDELSLLCREARSAWGALGDGKMQAQPSELGGLQFRRSIYFVRDLPAGSIVSAQDIRRIRPGMGLAPKYFDNLIGRRLRKDVTMGTATSWDCFE